MGRPARVNRETALSEVTQHFWNYGYEASSIETLLDSTGMHRGSFYRTFGDKEKAFSLALRHYMNRVAREHVFPSLMKGTSPRNRLINFIDLRLDDALGVGLGADQRPGCLVVNTATERAAHDARIRGLVATGLDAIREAIVRLVREAVESGETRPDIDADFAATQIFTLLQGANVMARTGSDAGELRALLHRSVDAALGPARDPVD